MYHKNLKLFSWHISQVFQVFQISNPGNFIYLEFLNTNVTALINNPLSTEEKKKMLNGWKTFSYVCFFLIEKLLFIYLEKYIFYLYGIFYLCNVEFVLFRSTQYITSSGIVFYICKLERILRRKKIIKIV